MDMFTSQIMQIIKDSLKQKVPDINLHLQYKRAHGFCQMG